MLQIGETQTGRTYDVAFDDAAFGTSRLGPVADTTAPSVPCGVTASAPSTFSVAVSWAASTDDVGVTSYDVLRDGLPVATVDGATVSYADDTVQASTTYTYSVLAADLAGNRSAAGLASPVTTNPSVSPPVFADGFETGDLSSWTTAVGLTVEPGAVRSGAYAAESTSPTSASYAKKALGSSYPDAYARVAFQVVSQGGQTTLLRLRTTPTGTGGYVYLTSGGVLAFRSDGETSGRLSSTRPGAGWHVVELHLSLPAAAGQSGGVQVWLDGAPVPGLTDLTATFGVTGVANLQIGDTQASTTGRDIVFDDAAFGTSRLGL